MLYSLLEQHTDGSWWYHRETYTNQEEAKEAEKWRKDHYGDRPWRIFKHTVALPQKTLYTFDFQVFYELDTLIPFNVKDAD